MISLTIGKETGATWVGCHLHSHFIWILKTSCDLISGPLDFHLETKSGQEPGRLVCLCQVVGRAPRHGDKRQIYEQAPPATSNSLALEFSVSDSPPSSLCVFTSAQKRAMLPAERSEWLSRLALKPPPPSQACSRASQLWRRSSHGRRTRSSPPPHLHTFPPVCPLQQPPLKSLKQFCWGGSRAIRT